MFSEFFNKSQSFVVFVLILSLTVSDLSLQFQISDLLHISSSSDPYIEPLSQQMIDHVNQNQKLWKAGKNFINRPNINLKSLYRSNGFDFANIFGLHSLEELETLENDYNVYDLPESFDSRDQWPKCQSIKDIRQQSNCGSCWAFAAVEAMSDRICIHSNQTKQVTLSPENLISCCGLFQCGFGCYGGVPNGAWNYWVKNGIVTGGDYGSNEGCQPYSISPDYNGIFYHQTPQCQKSCIETNSNLTYENSLHYGKNAYTIFMNPLKMQYDIMTNGPVEAVFLIYDDFFNYQSGVYSRTTNQISGSHCIKIIGWGTENNTPYWLVANSWGNDWGDNGFFKILRGSNECGIEIDVTAGIPNLE